MSERPAAIFEIAEPTQQTMRIFGVDYSVASMDNLSAIDGARLSQAGRELEAMGGDSDFDELRAKRLDAAIDKCITIILPALPATELARIGFMQRVKLMEAFMQAANLTPQDPIQELRPKKPTSTKRSQTSSATTAASA